MVVEQVGQQGGVVCQGSGKRAECIGLYSVIIKLKETLSAEIGMQADRLVKKRKGLVDLRDIAKHDEMSDNKLSKIIRGWDECVDS